MRREMILDSMELCAVTDWTAKDIAFIRFYRLEYCYEFNGETIRIIFPQVVSKKFIKNEPSNIVKLIGVKNSEDVAKDFYALPDEDGFYKYRITTNNNHEISHGYGDDVMVKEKDDLLSGYKNTNSAFIRVKNEIYTRLNKEMAKDGCFSNFCPVSSDKFKEYERSFVKMKSNKLMNLLGQAETLMKRKSPVILAGLAIAGVFSTACSAYKAGSKADEILENYRKDMNDCHPDDKEAKRAVVGETVKKMIPVIAPTIILGGTTIACIAGSQSISNRRIAVLSAAYNFSESTVKNLNSKMVEILGEKKTRAIKDSIMKDKLKDDSEKDKQILSETKLIIPNDGSVLCKDLYTGRPFHSTADKIRKAIAKCSYDIVSDMYISLNDFFDAIDSPELPRVPLGDDLGWGIDDTQNGLLPITLTALLTDDDKPCLCIEYDISVRRDLRSFY